MSLTLRLPRGELASGLKKQITYKCNIACDSCKGSGCRAGIQGSDCLRCGGQGRLAGKRTVRVSIPRNVRDGQKLRLTGAGETGAYGGASGDLFITVRIEG